MKNILFFFVIIILSACNEDCLDSSFTDIIVDQWEIGNPVGVTIDKDLVTFHQDGTGLGTDNGSFYTSSLQGGSNEFTWTINDNQDTLTISYTNGVTEKYTVNFLDCQEVLLDFEIAVLTLRK